MRNDGDGRRGKRMEKLKGACTGQMLPPQGLKAEGLSKKYRGFQLRNISFEIPPGNILGLLGRNGAGKTTTIKLLAGHTKKTAGNIWVEGINMERNPIQAKSLIGLMLDEPMFFETKSLWENGVAFGRFYPKFTEKDWKKWLSVCGLQSSSWLGLLSKGERMKFQFAFAMAHHPRVLLLDEPTGNLDAVFRKEFLDILQEAVEEEQISVLFSSHLTSDLERVADSVALLEQGELLYADSMENMTSRYRFIKGSREEGKALREEKEPGVVGMQVTKVGFEAILDMEEISQRLAEKVKEIRQEETDLDKWMYYMTKRGKYHGQHVEKDKAV